MANIAERSRQVLLIAWIIISMMTRGATQISTTKSDQGILLREACTKTSCFLVWDAIDMVDSYSVYCSESENGPYIKLPPSQSRPLSPPRTNCIITRFAGFTQMDI